MGKQERIGKGAPGPGRPKGSVNKMTQNVKDAFQSAYDGAGGIKAFTDWAKANPNLFYPLYSKLLPHDITSGGESLAKTRVIRPAKPNGQ